METQTSPLLNWPYFYQGKSMEELKHSLMYTTLELETTRLAAQEEIRKKEEQLTHVQELLNKAIIERNEAQENCKTLLFEKLLIQQQQQQQMVAPQVQSDVTSSSIEDDPSIPKKGENSNNNNGSDNNITSSDCEESNTTHSSTSPSSLSLSSSALPEHLLRLLPCKKQLPEKGKLLQAVMKAGPLLQTLLLAGPLPQWRHPPPPLENYDIPPVTLPVAAVNHQPEFLATNGSNTCGNVNRKRGFSNYVYEGYSAEASKYQRVLLH